MNPQDYAFAVAAARTLDTQWDEQTLDRIYGPKQQCLRLLQEKGWQTEQPAEKMCQAHKEQAWRRLMQWAPQPEAFRFLIVQNDFQNAAAALLSKIRGIDKTIWERPCLTDPETLTQALKENGDALPDWLREPEKRAEKALQESGDGPAVLSILRKDGLAATLALAEETRDELLKHIAGAMVLAENYKLAYQGAVQKADEKQIASVLCPQSEIEIKSWSKAAAAGPKALALCWRETGHIAAAEQMETKPGAAFEAWCNKVALKTAQKANGQIFGPGPLAAYYLQAKAEADTVYLALTAPTPGKEAKDRRRSL